MRSQYIHFEINGQADRRAIASIFADNGYQTVIEPIKNDLGQVIKHELVVACKSQMTMTMTRDELEKQIIKEVDFCTYDANNTHTCTAHRKNKIMELIDQHFQPNCFDCANGIPATKQSYSVGWDKCKGKHYKQKIGEGMIILNE